MSYSVNGITFLDAAVDTMGRNRYKVHYTEFLNLTERNHLALHHQYQLAKERAGNIIIREQDNKSLIIKDEYFIIRLYNPLEILSGMIIIQRNGIRYISFPDYDLSFNKGIFYSETGRNQRLIYVAIDNRNGNDEQTVFDSLRSYNSFSDCILFLENKLKRERGEI